MKSWSETKKVLLTTMILVVLTISVIILSGHTESVFAVDDNVTVIVNISTVSQIEVLPTNLEWILCSPGTDCGNQTIDVKNIGSVNLTNIYASVNTTEGEPANPLPLGTASSYSAGSLMAMANDTNLTWWFVGRQEWNISYVPTFYSPPDRQGVANRSWGWFRNTSSNYLWDLQGNETTGTCNNTGTYLNISTTPDAGTASTRSPSANGWDSTSAGFTQGTDWGLGTMNSGPFSEYCIATYRTCEKFVIFKYDKGSTYENECSKATYLRTSVLTPGDTVVYNVRAWVPQGIPAGNTTTAALTITAS